MIQDKTNKVLNVPPLRFPEFTGEWEKCKLGEIADIKTGPFGSILHAEDYVDDGVPIITTEHFKAGNLPIQKAGIPQVSIADYQRLKSYRLQRNDIVFSRVGSVDINAHTEREQEGWLFSGRVLRVRVNKNLNSRFLHWALSTSKNRNNIIQRAVGQTMPSINTEILGNTEILISPYVAEQAKISELHTILDKRITTQIRVIEDLKTLKKAIIERSYNIGGEVYKIGELIEQVSERRKANVYPVLSVNNRLGFIEQADQFEDRTVASDDTSNYKVVSTNDFAYNPARINVGSIARLKDRTNGIVSPMYVCFRTRSNILPDYFEFFFDTTYFKHEMFKRLEGSVRLCLSFEGLCNISMSVPSIDEQKKLSNRLSILEQKIQLESKILEAYRQQKMYLLQAMFI